MSTNIFRYLEKAHKEKKDLPRRPVGAHGTDLSRKARSAFKTGLEKVDEIREKRCTWTMRGWLETREDGSEVMVAEEMADKLDIKKDTDKQTDEGFVEARVEEKEGPETEETEEKMVCTMK